MPHRRQILITAAALLLVMLSVTMSTGGCASPKQVAARRVNAKAPAGPGPQRENLTAATHVAFAKFKTEDGLTLSGRIFGRGDVGVVLGHMYPATQTSWAPTARELARRGYRVLTFDFRGYGFSEGRKDISKIDLDMRAAAERLKEETDKVFLVGASMGGTAALRASEETKVRGVATISSPDEFMGLEAGRIEDIKRPKLFMAAAGDGAAPQTARGFYERSREPREISIFPGAAHGSELLKEPGGEAFSVLLDWLSRHD